MSTLTTTTTMTQAPLDTPNVSQRTLSPNAAIRQSSEQERFPSFDYSAPPGGTFGLPPVAESPAEAKPIEYKWPSRRASNRITTLRSGPRAHRPQRSLSDALAKFRNREGSVTENAQEVVEALKAPVSYKLIVGRSLWEVTGIANVTRLYVLCGI